VAEAVQQRHDVAERQVLVLVGPGNNGGDGLVAGRYLAEAGAVVAFYLLKPRDAADDENLARVEEMGLEVLLADYDQRYRVLRHRLRVTDILIDALLGTGVTRPIEGQLAALLEQVGAAVAEKRRAAAPGHRRCSAWPRHRPHPTTRPAWDDERPRRPIVVAVDCPSGLNCDSGALDPLAVAADLTVTFAGPKRGHFRFPGAAACGELVVADIDIDPQLPASAGWPWSWRRPSWRAP
jgi:NAD(P)H-hydrate repair Nnr-like enzyme with NAD(P)H-hydrate epimerase domain